MPKAGETIGPYTLISKLGRGAFGVVWLAEKRSVVATTRVALKLPNDEDVDLEAIKQEAAIWVHASGHPNVLPIIDADVYDEQIVIVSEIAPDGSLSKWMDTHGGKAPSVEAAAEMTLGILAGLEHLHERGVIHRDLKPDNILLQRETPRLADFGIARILKATAKTTVATGTPVYMSPEAFDGKRNERTDLWAVGVIFYELLTGSLPFKQTDISALMAAIIIRSPDPLPEDIPEAIGNIVDRAMKRDPAERWESATEMRQALRAAMVALESEPKVVQPVAETLRLPGETIRPEELPPTPSPDVPVVKTLGALPFSSPPVPPAPKAEARSRFTPWIAGAAVLLLVALTVMGVMLFRRASRINVMTEAARIGNSAKGLIRQGKYLDGAAAYRQAIALQPDDPEWRNGLCNSLVMTGREDQPEFKENLQQAERLARGGLTSNPSSPKMHAALANVLGLQDKNAEAETEYREAVRLDPENPEWRAFLADAIGVDAHRTADAEAEYRKAVTLAPDVDTYYRWLGRALRNQQRYEEAAQEFRWAIDRFPGNGLNHYELGRTLEILSRSFDAEAEFRQAIALLPPHMIYHFWLGIALFEQGKNAESEAQLRIAVDRAPIDLPGDDGSQAMNRFWLAKVLAQEMKVKEAEIELQKAQLLDPTNSQIKTELRRLRDRNPSASSPR
jgi:serine/threonine-protein kinase